MKVGDDYFAPKTIEEASILLMISKKLHERPTRIEQQLLPS